MSEAATAAAVTIPPPAFPLQEGEEVKMKLDGVRCRKGSVEFQVGVGQLFVTTKRVVWGVPKPDGTFSVEVSFTYHEYVFHAKTEPPMHAILVQLATEEEDRDDDEESPIGIETDSSNLWFFPASPDQVEPLFVAFSECSSLNPDQQLGEDEGENEMFFGDDDEGAEVEGKRAADAGVHSGDDEEDEHKQARMSGEAEEDIYADPTTQEKPAK
ncbi:hypothetical protein PAPYR_617 [Paratrimastix pyriformis]|uniref:Uncharacterized protein n=1 Tax=Paratrimastix pyriformis TaxID=342808 RepID=A0ABQ8UVM0_9EUKA|nr:hypothetical protein PAPYR_617 [Paratrimastix pyriformis]